MLERFSKHIDSSTGSQIMLLNADGYWLWSPNPEDEWGFMYPDRLGRTFGNDYPKAWEIIKAEKAGQFESPEGLFTFTTAYPLNNLEKQGGEDYYWKIVSFVPESILHADRNNRRLNTILSVAFLSIVFYFGLKRNLLTNVLRERTAKLLQESVVQYRDVFEGVNDAILVETIEGDVLDVNTRACELFGWSREEFLAKSIQDMVPPGVEALISEKNANTFETINMRANGEHFPVAITGRIQRIGSEKRLFVVVRDITEQKANELALISAKETAETATQVKADFLANMSHEIRTPLNAIFGMTSLMLDTPLDKEQQEFIETIRVGSDTLLSVINNILDFSKIEAGKMELEMQPFYLHSCI